jgi:hypothetical protein
VAERLVSWKVIADFAAVTKESKKAERSLDSLERKTDEFNATNAKTAPTSTAAARAQAAQAAAVDKTASATTKATSATDKLTAAKQRQVAASRAEAAAAKESATVYDVITGYQDKLAAATEKVTQAKGRARDESGRFISAAEAERRAAAGLVVQYETAADRLKKYRTEQEGVGTSSRGLLGRLRDLVAGLRDAGNGADGAGRSTARAGGYFDSLGKAARGLKVTLIGLAIPVVVGGLTDLLSVLSPAAAGFLGLAGAIAPAAGALAALPGLLAAAGGGVATLLLGFSGIGGALKAYGTQQKNAVKQTKAVENAQKAQASSAKSSAAAIKSAEQGVSSAQRNAADAQKAVTQARKEARQQIEDLQKSLKSLALQEEGASLSLEDARKRLIQVNNDPGSTDLERRQADLAVREAQARLGDVRDERKKTSASLKEANKKGVEGSDQVVAAKRAEADAQRSVADAEQRLADARKSSADASTQYAKAAREAAQGTDVFAEAMKALPPEAQAVVRQLLKMKPLLDQLRATASRGLLPGFLSFLVSASTLIKPVNRFVGEMAGAFGDFFEQVGKGLSSPTGVAVLSDIFDATVKVTKTLLKAFYDAGAAMGYVTRAAAPLTQWMANGVAGWAKYWRALTKGKAGQDRLERFFRGTRKSMQQLGRITGGLIRTLYALGKGTADLGSDMLDSFGDITQGWADMLNSDEGQKKIKKWADSARPVLHDISELIKVLVKGFVDLGKKTDLHKLLQQLNTSLLPAIFNLIGALTDPQFLSAIVSAATDIANFLAAIAPGYQKGIEGFVGNLAKVLDGITTLSGKVPGLTDLIGGLVAALVVSAPLRFASSLLGLTKPIEKVTGAVGKLAGKGVKKAGKAAGGALKKGAKNALISGAATADKVRNKVGKGGGAAAEAAEEAAADAPYKGRAKEGYKVGGKKAVKAAAKSAGKGGVGALEEAAPKAAGAVGKLGGVLKTVIGFIPTLLSALGPVGLAILAVAVVLGIVAYEVYKHWDAIKGYFIAAYEFLKPYVVASMNFILKIIQSVLGVIKSVWNAVWGVLGPVVAFVVRYVQFQLNYLWAIIKLIFTLIVTFAKIAWGLFTLFVIRPVMLVVATVWALLKLLWAYVVTAFNNIIAGVKVIWALFKDLVIQPVVDAFNAVKRALIAVGKWLVKQFHNMIDAVRIVWALIKYYVLKPIWDALAPVRKAFQDIWNAIMEKVRPLVDWVKTNFHKFIDLISEPIRIARDKVAGFLDKIKGKFEDWVTKIKAALAPLKDVVGKAFAAIRQAAADPIGFLVNKVLNPGLIEPYQKLAKAFNLPEVKTITWEPPKFAEGGRIPGGPRRGHGTSDSVLGVDAKGVPTARVSAGEFVMPEKKTRKFLPWLERMRRGTFEPDMPGFANGGVYDPRQKPKRRRDDHVEGVGPVPGFRDGGSIPNPEQRVSMDGEPLTAITKAQILLAERLSGTNMRVMQGSFQPPTSYSGTSHTGPGVADTSPGNFSMQSWLRKVGFAAWGRNFPGAKTAGSGAHVHSVSLVDPGSKNNSQARAYRAGGDGLGGKDYGPRPGIIPNLMELLGKIATNLNADGGVAGASQGPSLGSLLKKAFKPFSGLITKTLGNGDGNYFVKMVAAIPGKVLDGMVAKVKGLFQGGSGDAGSVSGGGGAAKENAKSQMPGFGFNVGSQFGPLDKLWTRESGWNPKALNKSSGAYGIPQALPGSKMASAGSDWKTNAATQIKWGLGYIKSRYGSPGAAWAHSQAKGWYARGTNAASQGPVVVGEHGPELVYMRGGERVSNNANTRRDLPRYNTGGYVRSDGHPGIANKGWVSAINARLHRGHSGTWSSGLTSALTKSKGLVSEPSFKVTDTLLARLMSWLKKRKGKFDLDDVAGGLKVDVNDLWRSGTTAKDYLTKKKLGKGQRDAFSKALSGYTSKDKAWIKSLEGELSLTKDGTWADSKWNFSNVLKHFVAHALKWPVGTNGHRGFDEAPWVKDSKLQAQWKTQRDDQAVFDANVAAQNRSNALNAEFDSLVSLFDSWNLPALVRKMNDLGVADGLTTGRPYKRNKTEAKKYNDLLQTEYDRSDSTDTSSKAGQITALIKAVTAGAGLQAAAAAAQVSMDTATALYDSISGSSRWTGIPASKRARFEDDTKRFKNIFKFASGGRVPGHGNGDRVHVLAEPGEFVLRKAAVSALRREFGPDALGSLNHADRFANGGFVAGGLGVPDFSPSITRITTTVNNPTLEDGAISVQRRVQRIAQLGLLNGDDR